MEPVDTPCVITHDEDAPDTRTELQEALSGYASDTFSYIDTVKGFLEALPRWMLMRETELCFMLELAERAAAIDPSVTHVTQTENKGKAFLQFLRNKFAPSVVERQRQELQEELGASLKATLQGLEGLGQFVDAVERLAVTSVQVFQENNSVLQEPEGGALGTVQDIITAAQSICPLLVEFKRNNQEFFSPKLQNVEVLAYQLDEYIRAVGRICGSLNKGILDELLVVKPPVVDVDGDIADGDARSMLEAVRLLQELRQDEAFRMVFLFQEESCSSFMKLFEERAPRMRTFLLELEGCAVQLDQMNLGARISGVVGSSVGAVGGILSIIGLALIPVTAGASLALTVTGVGLGITSGVNSAVTAATEIGVNRTQQKKASETFQRFMEDVKNIQDCLDDVTYQPLDDVDMSVSVGKILLKAGAVGKGIDSFVDGVSAVKLLQSDRVLTSASKVAAQEGEALRNVPRMAAEVPDVTQAAAKGPLALTRGARGGLIALNALFLGMDIFFIVRDSVSLARGSETTASRFLRARGALWRSEMASWQKVFELLDEGRPSFRSKVKSLKAEFYPDAVVEREKLHTTNEEAPTEEEVQPSPNAGRRCALQ